MALTKADKLWLTRLIDTKLDWIEAHPAVDTQSTRFRRMIGEHDAAAMLGMSVAMLRRWRSEKRGPRFRKSGRRVLYDIRDLDTFIRLLPSGNHTATDSARARPA